MSAITTTITPGITTSAAIMFIALTGEHKPGIVSYSGSIAQKHTGTSYSGSIVRNLTDASSIHENESNDNTAPAHTPTATRRKDNIVPANIEAGPQAHDNSISSRGISISSVNHGIGKHAMQAWLRT